MLSTGEIRAPLKLARSDYFDLIVVSDIPTSTCPPRSKTKRMALGVKTQRQLFGVAQLPGMSQGKDLNHYGKQGDQL